jgi:hypothetical protein
VACIPSKVDQVVSEHTALPGDGFVTRENPAQALQLIIYEGVCGIENDCSQRCRPSFVMPAPNPLLPASVKPARLAIRDSGRRPPTGLANKIREDGQVEGFRLS